jgi:enoyl-CoA hydratase/carnithine racemase
MGVAPEAASSYLLPRRMGAQRAAHALFTAEWISADQAVDAGLALRACDPETLLAESLALAESIAAKPLASLVATKRLLREAEGDGVRRALALEAAAFAELLRAPAMRDLVLAQLPDRN